MYYFVDIFLLTKLRCNKLFSQVNKQPKRGLFNLGNRNFCTMRTRHSLINQIFTI